MKKRRESFTSMPELSALSDSQLVLRIKAAPSPSAVEVEFCELVKRHSVFLENIVKGKVPSSEVEEVFWTVWEGFWASLPRFRGDASVRWFLARIAYNTMNGHLRGIYRRRSAIIYFSDLPDEQREQIESGSHPDTAARLAADVADFKIEKAKLDDAINKLPEGQREALVLFWLEGKTYEEAAKVTGRSVGSLRVAVHGAVDNLNKSLKSFLTYERSPN